MKLRLLISILFVIATTATAIHELEHIHSDDSSSCQVCIVDDHSVSGDAIQKHKEVVLFKFKDTSTQNLVYPLYVKNHSYQNRAPPLKS